jgi:hypothetical protein
VIILASGGLSGGFSSAIAGGKFVDGFRQGIITSGLNHIAHDIVGTIQFNKELRDFLIDAGYEGKLYEFANLSNEQIGEFAAKVFPDLYNSANKPKFEVLDLIDDKPNIMGRALKTVTVDSKGIYTVKSNGLIQIKKQVLLSYFHLASVVGHELNHVIDHVDGTYQKWANHYKDIKAGNVYSELKAYGWELSLKSPYTNHEEYIALQKIQNSNKWKF